MTYLLIILTLIAAGLAGGMTLMGMRASEARQKLEEAGRHIQTLLAQLEALKGQLEGARGQDAAFRRQLETLQSSNDELNKELETIRAGDSQKTGWLDHQQEEINWLRAELEKRPQITRKIYKILTVGVKWTGKTSLTLKWANPLIDLGALQGTKIERYERTVSQVLQQEVLVEHVFQVGDWGGEHIVDAQQELLMEEINGMLIVVDLGSKDAKTVEPARIQEQLREFQPESLKFFFGPKTVASCKTVVLFINKSDLLSGTPLEVEAQAKSLYQRLINDLMKYNAQIDIRVFVGSATYGHSTHHLFSHFVEKILPKNAYDPQLLQRLKSETPHSAAVPGQRPPPPFRPPLGNGPSLTAPLKV